jgi:amidophosphoribosyltransferase
MCGIFGIANHAEASRMTYLGLYALQHRGQESTGIASSDEEQVISIKRWVMLPTSTTKKPWRS